MDPAPGTHGGLQGSLWGIPVFTLGIPSCLGSPSTGDSLCPANLWGWDSEGRRSCSPRVRGVSGQEGFSWDAQGFGQAAELHIPHQSVYKPSVLPAEQMCRAWGLNSLLRKSLMLKSRAPALGVRYEELVGPLLVLSL